MLEFRTNVTALLLIGSILWLDYPGVDDRLNPSGSKSGKRWNSGLYTSK